MVRCSFFSHCLCVVLFYIFCSWTSTVAFSSIIFCAILLELVYDNDMVCFECKQKLDFIHNENNVKCYSEAQGSRGIK